MQHSSRIPLAHISGIAERRGISSLSMLTTLRIRNIAIVEDLRVEFQPGLNTITGETGAGKSILMGALSLLLGERADKSVIRTGETQASVEAALTLPDTKAVDAILAEAGIESCQDSQLVLRRVVSASSGGGIFINGCSATVQTLKKTGNLLVDMHGPHDHQSLLSPDFQMDILDAFGGLHNRRTAYQKEYTALCELQAQRRALDCDEKTVADQIDMLSFQVKEIGEAALVDGEEEEIKNKHSRMANAERIIESARNVCQALSESDNSIVDSLGTVQRELDGLAKIMPEAVQWRKDAGNALVSLQELSRTISSSVHDIEHDPRQLEHIEARLGIYQKMKRKYGASIPEILAKLDDAKKRLHDLETRGERIAEIEAGIAKTKESVLSAGGKLGKERRTAAKELASAITAQLQDLGFAKGAFHVPLSVVEPGPTGIDAIEFGFAPNIGEAMRPLRTIASSGEISRVMLATKAVLAKHDRISVLVFDEIDTNVGGEMGFAIGSKLAGIAGNHQVICITHLPQVAVYGTSHFAVAKRVRGERTYTEIGRIEGEERIEEIARMLGGKSPTKLTRDHARELLDGVIARQKRK